MPWPKIDKRRVEGIRVPGDGPKPAKIMVVAERPGIQEPLAGRPFIGAAGKELDRYLALAGIKREDCYVTNVVKDYKDEDPTEEEIARDTPELEREIEEVQPELILPVGRFAARFFLGDVDMERIHGLLHFTDRYGAVYPAFHPAAGLHSSDSIQYIQWDFEGLRDPGERIIPTDMYAGRERYGKNSFPMYYHDMAIDTEGSRERPWCLTFSQIEGEAAIVRAEERDRCKHIQLYIERSEGMVYLHNSMYDLGVLRGLGIHVPGGRFIDTMVLAYLLCLLPQGLKSLSYRLKGMEMDSYEEVVAPARAVVWQEWMEAAIAVADACPQPDAELVWEAKLDEGRGGWRVKQPQTIAQRMRRMMGDVEKKGFLTPQNPDGVDVGLRVQNWTDTAADFLVTAVGAPREPEMGDIPEANAVAYACRDADATLRVAPILMQMVKEEGMERICAIDHAIIPMVDRMQSNGILVNKEYMHELEARITEQMESKRDEIEALVGVRINPSSPPQVAALLFKQLGLKSRKTTESGRDSTGDKVLEALRREHPVLPLIMDYRELNKARGSFVRCAIRDSGADDRLRCNLRVTRVSSGRLAANTPNLMAFPVRSEIGKEIRRGFVAPPGKVLADWDLDQAEMRFMAHESDDEGLVRVFTDGKLDIHTDTASRMFGVPYDKVDKNLHRYPAKRVGFGVITGITGAGLVDQMALAGVSSPDGDEYTEDECSNFIDLWFAARPGVKGYMDRCRAEARRNGKVADLWGRVRYLPGVWSTVERIREEACRQSHSHKIQAGAQGYMKMAMANPFDPTLGIWWWLEHVWWPRGGRWAEIEPLLQIHDSLLFELPDEPEIIQEVDEIVVMCMSGTYPLKVPMGAKGGRAANWGDLKD